MNGLILASYVLKVQQDNARNEDFPEAHRRAHASARSILAPLGAAFTGLAVFLVALQVFP